MLAAALLLALACGSAAADANGTCGDSVTWTYTEADSTLTISGYGAMSDYPSEYPGFYEYSSEITSIVISPGITYIGEYAFYGMTAAVSASVPDNVSTINNGAFGNCTHLAEVTVMDRSVFYGQKVFDNCASGLVLRSFSGSTTETYAKGYGLQFAQPRCGDKVSFDLSTDGKTMTVAGSGPMWDYLASTGSPLSYNTNITAVKIGKGVTSIGNSAFEGFLELKSVTIPDTVKSIGDRAFYYCGLTKVSIPGSTATIGASAFAGCSGLKTLTLGEGVKEIGKEAFHDCSPLESISFPFSLTSLGSYCFMACDSLKDVTFVGMSVLFGSDVFWECDDMTIHGWPASTAEDYAAMQGHPFQALSAPAPDFFLPASLTKIGVGAFNGISARAAVIPKGVTSVSGNPFAGSSVTVIYGYEGSQAAVFAANYGYYFVAVDDAWMASHK